LKKHDPEKTTQQIFETQDMLAVEILKKDVASLYQD